jgi:hypothetical protein
MAGQPLGPDPAQRLARVGACKGPDIRNPVILYRGYLWLGRQYGGPRRLLRSSPLTCNGEDHSWVARAWIQESCRSLKSFHKLCSIWCDLSATLASSVLESPLLAEQRMSP